MTDHATKLAAQLKLMEHRAERNQEQFHQQRENARELYLLLQDIRVGTVKVADIPSIGHLLPWDGINEYDKVMSNARREQQRAERLQMKLEALIELCEDNGMEVPDWIKKA
jgi:hypothetical protein